MAQHIQLLVIHCTATPEGREVTGNDIRLWHLSPKPKGRGWKQVGYTDLIKLDGSIERLAQNNEDGIVDSWEITNGVLGKNTIARHIAYAGGSDSKNKPKDTRTARQRDALKKYVLDFIRRFPHVQVAGHNQFTNEKACPSFLVPQWLRSIGVSEKNIYQGASNPLVPAGYNTSDNTQSEGGGISKIVPPLLGLITIALGAYFYLR